MSGSVTAVSIVSLVCALLQLVYIVSILWLLRVRRHRLQASAEKLPTIVQQQQQQAAIAETSEKQQETTQVGYYSNFLPQSFHSVVTAGPLSGSLTHTADFSYQTNHTPLSHGHLSASLGPGSNGLPVHPDMGQLSFSASLADRGQGRGADLYDEDDHFTPHPEHKENSEPAISPIKPQSAHSQHARGRLASLAEDDGDVDQDLMIMPTSVGAGLHLAQHLEDSVDDDDDMTVSLDGDEPVARNVELIVDDLPNQRTREIQLEKSRSPVSQTLTGGSKAASYQVETLHVSAAPFSLPPQASRASALRVATASVNAGDSYSLLSGGSGSGGDEEDPFRSSALPLSHPPRAQSRHIMHPKSSSYHRNGSSGDAHGGFLSGSAVPEGMLGMWVSGQDGAGGPKDQARKRRASLSRRMAASKAASASLSHSGSSGGILISAAGANFSRDKAKKQSPLDPNASPIRSKVKFADSPRDRTAAEQMRKLQAPTIGQAVGPASEAPDAGATTTTTITTTGQKADADGVVVAVQQMDGASTSTVALASTQAIVPRERSMPGKPLLKYREPPAPLAPAPIPTPDAPLLVLPIYYRFLVLQLIHCAAWTAACLILLAFGTNLVEWGTRGANSSSSSSSSSSSEEMHGLMYDEYPTAQSISAHLIDASPYDSSLGATGVGDGGGGASHSWVFGITMGVLMAIHACVLDGLLVFLASRHVGRAAIRFSSLFGLVWGGVNGVLVIIVTQAVPMTPSELHGGSGLLPMSHPFFVRSCLALALNLAVVLLPQSCFCGMRARRTNTWCVKGREEKAMALQRQQIRWELQARREEEYMQQQQQQRQQPQPAKAPPHPNRLTIATSYTATVTHGGTFESEDLSQDSFDEDDYVTGDDEGGVGGGSKARDTWFRFGLFNIVFHTLVLTCYILDFSHTGGTSTDEQTWEMLLMILLAVGFVTNTPILYYCLSRDSRHWSQEWKGVLERMKQESEADAALRKQERAEEEAKALREGRPPPAEPPQRPSAYATFHSSGGGGGGGFFLDYSLLEYGPMLGSGGFSSVYSARLGKFDVAVKVLHVRDLTKEVIEQFLHEVGIVLQLNHPNVVHFLGVVFSPPDMSLVMERCRRQSLLHLIKHQKVKFSEFQAVSIGLAIADGLRYIHEQDILHRDLKAANILFDQSGRPKICDFGLSEERSKIDLNRVFCGTLAYMSPEVLRSETVGKPSDVYSFSIILWELLHNELAWKRGSNQKHGLNARVLVEMVAYRRARPPVKERPVDQWKGATPPNSLNGPPPAHPLPADSARIHPQAFAPDPFPSSSAHPTSHGSGVASRKAPGGAASSPTARPGIHPMLVQLLRECWRDDYRRRPSFVEIVQRLSAFREMIRAQQA